MTGHDEMTDDLEQIERLLQRFRPVGLPASLRKRALAEVRPVLPDRAPRRVALCAWRAAVAAGVILAVCLNMEAERISSRTAGQVGIGPAIWTRQAEEAAQMFDGESGGRQYLAMALIAGPLRNSLAQCPAGLEGSNHH